MDVLMVEMSVDWLDDVMVDWKVASMDDLKDAWKEMLLVVDWVYA